MEEAAQLRYSKGAIILHWAIAALILYNLASGLLHDALPRGFFQFHVSSGITILVLTILRIVWRLTHRPPPMLPIAAWEKGLAHLTHFLLYLAMLAAPLTGWAMISAYVPKPRPAAEGGAPATPAPAAGPAKPRQTMIWGVIPLPKIAPIANIGKGPDGAAKLHEAHETFEERHELAGWIFLGLLVLHIAGALKHELIDKKRQLARMGVGRTAAKRWDRAA
jgi:cytochrome b561